MGASGSGRPSSYDELSAQVICDRLSVGETLRAICRTEGMPTEPQVRHWIISDTCGFSSAYARAREIGLESQIDEMMDVARDGTRDRIVLLDGTEKVDNECVQRSRLIVDTIKWLASKRAPKVFGDRLELAGDKDAPLTITVRRRDKE